MISVSRVDQRSTALRTAGTHRIANTPHGDSHTLGLGQAALRHGDVVVGVVALNIKLRDGDLLHAGGSESLDSAGQASTLPGRQVALRADAVDGNAGRQPLLDVGHHALGQLRRRRAVEVVVVDVQLSIRVCCAGGVEGDLDKVLAQNLREDRVAKGTVLSEDLVADVL